MIPAAHDKFRRWAVWVLAPVPGINLGYGKNICQRIMEGKGQLLPGAPRGSGPVKIHTDPVASQVEGFIRTQCNREEKFLLKTFYLSQYWTVEQKAKACKCPVRTMYDRLERLQVRLLNHLDVKK